VPSNSFWRRIHDPRDHAAKQAALQSAAGRA
jgi:hypothetical protein